MKIKDIKTVRDFSEAFNLTILDEEFDLKDFSPLESLWWMESLRSIAFSPSPRMRDQKIKGIIDKTINIQPIVQSTLKKLENNWIYLFGFSYLIKFSEDRRRKLFLDFYSLAANTVFAGTFRSGSKWELGLRHLKDLMDFIVERLLEIPDEKLPENILDRNNLIESVLHIYPEIVMENKPIDESLRVLIRLKAAQDNISHLGDEVLYNIYSH